MTTLELSRTPVQAAPRKREARTSKRLSTLLVYVAMLLIAVVYLFPLFFLLNTALKAPGEFNRDPMGIVDAPALENFSAAWRQGDFGSLVANSVVYAMVSATVSTVLSVFIAFPVARNYVRWSRFFRVLFVISLFLPNALVAQFQLVLQLGLYDTRLGYMLLMTAGLGLGPLLVMGYLRSLPRELDEAAALDGCGYLRYVLTFVFPLCRPVVITVFLLQVIGVWNDIIGATIYLASPELRTISLGLFSFYGQYGNNQWELLSAATLIVAGPLILLFLLAQRFFVSGAIGGALK
ncbi:binding-protein-dependent transport systems inner membrane component [Beutenbergia cavernae DSM 12333]|uniref:Binding-protein-dependent transport systems inner membrane component n=1 Tax=Beutenbergia cavernae (strain ATCC BAA-8 / DSM 12333 / CCUG 43141 / JCM 11478 / NBRC 16432 / NCIMB 13614 / HKI 0122) TaxID=471853 RepID=C5BX24_BEUC1|nr:carbohydrate ABC transporter permease [Beutenbergia cavernae]ACQ78699.1 binding-protein-dependent transport systems inner membrane component [Beutenbergia cavernae DSM 12333]